MSPLSVSIKLFFDLLFHLSMAIFRISARLFSHLPSVLHWTVAVLSVSVKIFSGSWLFLLNICNWMRLNYLTAFNYLYFVLILLSISLHVVCDDNNSLKRRILSMFYSFAGAISSASERVRAAEPTGRAVLMLIFCLVFGMLTICNDRCGRLWLCNSMFLLSLLICHYTRLSGCYFLPAFTGYRQARRNYRQVQEEKMRSGAEKTVSKEESSETSRGSLPSSSSWAKVVKDDCVEMPSYSVGGILDLDLSLSLAPMWVAGNNDNSVVNNADERSLRPVLAVESENATGEQKLSDQISGNLDLDQHSGSVLLGDELDALKMLYFEADKGDCEKKSSMAYSRAMDIEPVLNSVPSDEAGTDRLEDKPWTLVVEREKPSAVEELEPSSACSERALEWFAVESSMGSVTSKVRKVECEEKSLAPIDMESEKEECERTSTSDSSFDEWIHIDSAGDTEDTNRGSIEGRFKKLLRYSRPEIKVKECNSL